MVGSIGRSVGGDTLFLSASYSVQEEEEERKTTRKLEATADINMVTTYKFSYFFVCACNDKGIILPRHCQFLLESFLELAKKAFQKHFPGVKLA